MSLPKYHSMPSLAVREDKLKTARDKARDDFERLSHTGGEDFYDAAHAFRIAHDEYQDERSRDIFPSTVSCREFEHTRADKARRYRWWLACAVALPAVIAAIIFLAASGQ
jgi:hypothetical protein